MSQPVSNAPLKDAAAPFNKPSADLILRSSDHVDFRVKKDILTEASPVFDGMVSLPVHSPVEPNNPDFRDGLPVVRVTETSRTLDHLLRFCYPILNPELGSEVEICEVLEAVRKYMMEQAEKDVGEQLERRASKNAVFLYALCSRHIGWENELRIAAKASLEMPIENALYSVHPGAMDARSFMHLHEYHKQCGDALADIILTSTVDSHSAERVYASAALESFMVSPIESLIVNMHIRPVVSKEEKARRQRTLCTRSLNPFAAEADYHEVDESFIHVLEHVRKELRRRPFMGMLHELIADPHDASFGGVVACECDTCLAAIPEALKIMEFTIEQQYKVALSQVDPTKNFTLKITIITTFMSKFREIAETTPTQLSMSSAHDGEGDSSGVRGASAPFDKPSADLILRSSDHVDFRVKKDILTEASPVFEGMLSLPQSVQPAASNLGDHRDGLPVVRVTESSQTLDNLLRFCYPVLVPELKTALEICDTLDAARKYMMERAEKDIREQFARHAKEEPLALYALSTRHIGWEDELKIAAKESLRFSIDSWGSIPEVRAMNSVDSYMCLQTYHQKCGELLGSEVISKGLIGPASGMAFAEQTYVSTCMHDVVLHPLESFVLQARHQEDDSLAAQLPTPREKQLNMRKRTLFIFGKTGDDFDYADRQVDEWVIHLLEFVRDELQKRPHMDTFRDLVTSPKDPSYGGICNCNCFMCRGSIPGAVDLLGRFMNADALDRVEL
ncbi:hypothetical protein EIP91_008023 [Steccherinum ochraceum]|uniref:BTB domain-containing protein n=1 Tax=Steccherinum ochraceum TaxID=92696 RepID=A0A4R0RHB3_9APHY|nr:hypothetical protein EIP91_008023 [Steccherinum ochraceum]